MDANNIEPVVHIIEYKRLSNKKSSYLVAVWAMGMVSLFPILHGIINEHYFVGISIYVLLITISGYFVLCLTFNRIRLIFTNNHLTIKHIPALWFGNDKIAIDTIKDVYYEKDKVFTRSGCDICYRVMARLVDGRRIGLIIEDLIYEEEKACELVNNIKDNVSKILKNRGQSAVRR